MSVRAALGCCLLLAACGGEAELPLASTTPDRDIGAEAEARYPSLLQLHHGVIARSCSPNPGVCHAGAVRPALRTPAELLLTLGADCNQDPIDPRSGWDGCERSGDRLATESIRIEIAWTERVELGVWRFGLRAPVGQSEESDGHVERADGRTALLFDDDYVPARLVVTTVAGSSVAVARIESEYPLAYTRELYDPRLAFIHGGDPNRNGVYGGDEGESATRVVWPGDLARSYLWGRVTGTRPGSRMPLANQPLDDVDYMALACWIEGLSRTDAPRVTDAIEYRLCSFREQAQ